MALEVATGNFTKPTTTGSHTPVTGLSFQPKAIIFTSGGAATDATWLLATYMTIGFAAGIGNAPVTPTQAAMGYFYGVTTTMQAGHYMAAKAIALSTNTGTVRAEADCTINSDGFSLNWTTNTTPATIINWIALGGSDITGAFVKTFASPSIATNPHAVTGVGFQPDCIIMMGCKDTGTLPQGTDHAPLHLGVATAAASWALSNYFLDGSNEAHTVRAMDTGIVVLGTTGTNANPTVASINESAALVSMDSDGFTLNYTVATAAWIKAALCLKGGSYAIGTQAKTTGASGSADTISGLAFTPTGLLIGSAEKTAGATAVLNARTSIGQVGGGAEAATHYSSQDQTATSSPRVLQKNTKAAIINDADTSAIAAEADAALTGDGFTMTWSTNNAVAVQYGYLAFGDAGGGAPAVSFVSWIQDDEAA